MQASNHSIGNVIHYKYCLLTRYRNQWEAALCVQRNRLKREALFRAVLLTITLLDKSKFRFEHLRQYNNNRKAFLLNDGIFVGRDCPIKRRC
jgi:hypothetical protein